MVECPVCAGNIELKEGTEKNELVSCQDCGVDLEVVETSPITLKEAPQEEEDWGE